MAPRKLGFRPDRKITDVLRERPFTVSAEIIPPRNGTEQDKVLTQIEGLVDSGAQFLSVTKGAGGSLRGGSLPIAQTIKEQFDVPCIAHFTCRDLTPQDIENQLVDHHYFGIRNILGLRGDPPTDQPEWRPQTGAYPYAYQLIEQIRKMNEGQYFARTSDAAHTGTQAAMRTDFCIGAAVYPEHPDATERLRFFELKVRAGAEFAITQMVFDAEAYARFVDQCSKTQLNLPILPGTRALKSQAQARRMAERFQVSVPPSYLKDLPEENPKPGDTGAEKQALEANLKFYARLKALGAPGLHLFVLNDTNGACQILTEFAKSF